MWFKTQEKIWLKKNLILKISKKISKTKVEVNYILVHYLFSNRILHFIFNFNNNLAITNLFFGLQQLTKSFEIPNVMINRRAVRQTIYLQYYYQIRIQFF